MIFIISLVLCLSSGPVLHVPLIEALPTDLDNGTGGLASLSFEDLKHAALQKPLSLSHTPGNTSREKLKGDYFNPLLLISAL